MNKVWEIGRLTKEPEIRYTSKKNGNGEEESTKSQAAYGRV